MEGGCPVGGANGPKRSNPAFADPHDLRSCVMSIDEEFEGLVAERTTASGPGWGIRRVTKWGIAVLVFVALLAAAGWSFAVPRYRPGLRDGESYGIDVSHHQKAIDWPKVASDRISFAYIKATEGGDHVDDRFKRYAADAEAAGLKVGAYHFFTFCRPGAEQAANFLKTAPPIPSWLPPAVDVEFGGNCSARPAEAELLRELTKFIELVSTAWHQPVIVYALHDVVDRYPKLAELDAPVWQRHLFTRPGNDEWSIWQISGFARVEGIDGAVDLNIGKLVLTEN